nr:PREDICTED: uncharacterized protein LOC105678056 [Linepithema humile]
MRHYDKINIDDSSQKSIRRQQRRKSDANHSVEKKQKCHQRRNNHYRNAEIKDISSESSAVNNSPQQKTIINEKCEEDNIIIPMSTSSKTKIMICNTMMDKIENSTDLRQKEPPKDHENYTSKDIGTESSSYKKILNSSTVSEIKNKIEYESPMCKSSNHRDCSYNSSYLFTAKARYSNLYFICCIKVERL